VGTVAPGEVVPDVGGGDRLESPLRAIDSERDLIDDFAMGDLAEAGFVLARDPAVRASLPSQE
jgi:hypothetical protein